VGLARFNERGITTFASIILGFPGETEESVRRTIDFLNETAPTFWRVQAWWANPRSPIFVSREVHRIEGQSYTWRHRSMDSQQAAALCDCMFDAVTASTWLPLYDFDFWSLPYMAGKYISHEQVRLMLDRLQRLISERDKTDPDQSRLATLYDEVRTAVRATAPAPARFHFDSDSSP
jgi:hypothetical protein